MKRVKFMEINGIIYIFDDDAEMHKLWEIQKHYRENGGDSPFITSILEIIESAGKITYDQFEVVKKIYDQLGLYSEF